jgi:hypothetical protein
MYKEILYEKQVKVIEILSLFSNKFYLAGWTAIALQLWHRKSIDFDLFSSEEIKNSFIINKLNKVWYKIDRILIDNKWEELTLIISGVKITFLYYPFEIELEKTFEWISLPSLEILWAMKFYTLWRRSKWKDYVDVYFLFKNWYELSKISDISENIFKGWYNEKLLREQLCYYKDIDYTEEVDYLNSNIDNSEIEKYLIDISRNK